MVIYVTAFGGRAMRLVISGNLNISGAEKLDLPLAALAGRGGSIVVDMTGLKDIASIAIRHFVLAARTLGRRGGQLLLLSPSPHVANALMLAGVGGLLPIVQSEDEALARLSSRVQLAADDPSYAVETPRDRRAQK
jgi:anti-anti-sigma factor